MPIFTVGHSNHYPDQLFNLLAQFGITHIIDVRSVPYSGRFPYFNKDNLKSLCKTRNMNYEWRGDRLGGLRDGFPSFETIAESSSFIDAVQKLISDFPGENSDRTACLLCAEKDPTRCHRSVLIGPALHKLNVDLHHILADGTLKLQSELAEQMKVPKSDRSGTLSMFDS